jgi:hypothetical protein
LEQAVVHLSIGRVEKGSDAIVLGATNESQLSRVMKAKASLKLRTQAKRCVVGDPSKGPA